MWYSFLGASLTVLFGLLISLVSDCIATTAINGLNAASAQPDAEKPGTPAVTKSSIDMTYNKDSEPVFIVERHREGKQLKGYDNTAMES